MSDTVVVVPDTEPDTTEAETASETQESVVDAAVGANDAEHAAEDSEQAAADAAASDASAWFAAEAAWQSTEQANAVAAQQQQQIDQLSGIAANLVTATDNLVKVAGSNAGVLPDPGPDGVVGTTDDVPAETPPSNGAWLSRKWGKR